MAYSASISKVSVERLTDDDFAVTISARVTDASLDVVLDEIYTERYYRSLPVSAISGAFQSRIKRDWDKLIAERQILDAPVFDSALSDIETSLNQYINK